MTFSLNTPIPFTPIYDELLAERGTPLPETEPGDVTPVPPHTHVTEPYSRELLSIAARAADAAEAYGEEANGAASDVGRIHETTCRDLRHMHHIARVDLGLVKPQNVQAYLDAVDEWDVARVHDVPVDMVTSIGMLDRLPELTAEIAVDPSAPDPEATTVIAKVTVEQDGHPVVFSVRGSREVQEPGESTVGMPPRYYEALRDLKDLEAAERPVDPYFTALAKAYEHDVVLAVHGADDGERGDQALANYVNEIAPEEDEVTHQVMDGSDDPAHADDCDGCVVDALKDPALHTRDGMQVIVDMLGLVCVDATLEQVESWSVEQRAEAVNWAGLTHLSASDNPVEVPPRPTFLPCDGSVFCTSTEHEDGCFGPLGQVKTQFWACPDHDKGIVEWDGDVAVCMEDGCKRTSETPREADGE